MELSSLMLFLYFRREPSEPKKIKKIHSEKTFFYFGKWNFLVLNLKKIFLYFKKELAKAESKKIFV